MHIQIERRFKHIIGGSSPQLSAGILPPIKELSVCHLLSNLTVRSGEDTHGHVEVMMIDSLSFEASGRLRKNISCTEFGSFSGIG